MTASRRLHGNLICYPCSEIFHASAADNDGEHLTCPNCGRPGYDTRVRMHRRVRCENCGGDLEKGQIRWCGPVCFGAGHHKFFHGYEALAAQQGNLCGICLLPLPPYYGGMAVGHVDHIVPQHHGGTNLPDNLAATHIECNLFKGDDPLTVARRRLGMTDAVRLRRLRGLPDSEHRKLGGETLRAAPKRRIGDPIVAGAPRGPRRAAAARRQPQRPNPS